MNAPPVINADHCGWIGLIKAAKLRWNYKQIGLKSLATTKRGKKMTVWLKITLSLAAILLIAVTAPVDATSSADDSDLASISAPAYVKELYRTLSKQNSENTDATTIRSIAALRDGKSNGNCACALSRSLQYIHVRIMRARGLGVSRTCT